MNKAFLSTLAIAFVLPQCLMAAPNWDIVTDTNRKIPLSEVAAFIASSDETLFAVVSTDGSVINDVKYVTLEEQSNSIGNIRQGATVNFVQTDSKLAISNCKDNSDITVSSIEGKTIWHGTAKNGKAEIDISNTENGIYILKIGKTSLKVIKK